MIKNNTFLFGGSGFIGTHLNNYLKKKKNVNLVSSKKILKKEKNIELFYKKFWEKIVAKSNTIIYLSFNNDLEHLKKNLSQSFVQNLIPLYILCEVIKKKEKNIKIIYLSTASLYANNIKLPGKESAKKELNNIYEFLKYLSEQILINSSNKYLNYQILRLSNVYGENISKKKQNNRQVLTKIISDAFKKKKIKIFGSGNYIRDFIHVEDVCSSIYKIITKNNLKNEIFNIGSGKQHKLINIFNIIKNYINENYNYSIKIKKIKLDNININKSDLRNFQASIEKSKKKIDWEPKISFENGIKNLIEYVNYKKN